MREELKKLLKGLCLGGGLMALTLGGGAALAGTPGAPMMDEKPVVSRPQDMQDQMQMREQMRDYMTQQRQDCLMDGSCVNGTTPSCDPEHLGLCPDEESCEMAGGHWFDGSCHRGEPGECMAQGQMSDEGQNGATGTCANGTMPGPAPSCDPFHLGNCQDQESCEMAGGHWFEDSCHRYALVDMEECVARAEARHYRNGDPLMDPARDRHQVRAQKATIGCELMVPPEDQGQEARLAMFAFCPDHPEWGWMDLSNMLNQKRVRLGEKIRIGLDADLSSLAGMRFHVCGGYLTEDGTIGYHCFEVDVEE